MSVFGIDANLRRIADRQNLLELSQLPPRITRNESPAVTSGSVPPVSSSWYEFWHISHTLACMSCSSHGLGTFRPTGCVPWWEFARHHAKSASRDSSLPKLY